MLFSSEFCEFCNYTELHNEPKKSFWSIPPLPPIQLKKFIMGYAVLHTEKGKTSSGGIGNHIDRTKGKEHTYKHADPSRLHLNKNFNVPGDRHKMKLSDAIQDRLDSGYNGKRKIRTDAVKYATHILTGSHEDMKEIFANQKKKEQWIQANYNFIAKEFGSENIVRFSLHLDEKTPHIHAVTVPLTADGRLSARDVLGNPKAFKTRQDRYAKAMEPFGLKRGVKDTGIKHEDAKAYYKRINIENEEEIKPPRRIFGLWEGVGVVEQTNALKSLKNEFKEVKKVQQQYFARNVELHKQLEQEKEKNQKYYNNPKAFVQDVNREKQRDKMLTEIDYAVSHADYLLRNPKKIDIDDILTNSNGNPKKTIVNQLCRWYNGGKTGPKKMQMDKEFWNDNLTEILDLDSRTGGRLEYRLDSIIREVIAERKRAQREQQREKQMQERKQRTQSEEEEPRRNKGRRR